MRRRSIAALSVITLLFGSPLVTLGEATLSPQLWDAGIIKPGSSQTLKLVITNNGSMKLAIKEARVECAACTKVEFKPATLAPHDTIEVPITFDPPESEDGPVQRTVVFLTSDAAHPIVFRIKAYLTSTAGISPNMIGTTVPQPPGSDYTQTISLVNVSASPLTPLYSIGPVDAPQLALGHTAIAGRSSSSITAKWHLPAKPGVLSGQIILYVNHTDLTKMVIPYQITVADVAASQPAAAREKTAVPAATLPAASAPPVSVAPPLTTAGNSPAPAVSASVPATKPSEMIDLQLKDGLTLKDLVEIIATQLNLNLIYDEAALAVPVTVRLNGPLPQDALLPLLKTVLQAKGFALVSTDRPDIWRIVTSREAQTLAEPGKTGGPEQIVTEFIKPGSVDLETAAGLLRGFTTSGIGQITTVPSAKVLIVTDYANQLARLHRLMDLIDKPVAPAAVQIVPLKAAEAAPLVDRINKLAEQIAKSEGRDTLDHVFLSAGDDGASVIIVGSPDQLQRMTDLVAKFDVAPTLVRVDYSITDAQRVMAVDTVRQLLGKEANAESHDGLPRILVTPTRLSVAATEGQQRRIKEFLGQNEPTNSGGVILKAYRIENRDASEVYATLTRLLGDIRGNGMSLDVVQPFKSRYDSGLTTEGISTVGRSIPPPIASPITPASPAALPAGPSLSSSMAQGPVNITVDEGTNTLLVAATPETHAKLGSLIEQLDRKQAQVLMEVILVSVSDSDTLAYALETAVKASISGSTVGVGTDAGIGSGDFTKGRTPVEGQGGNLAILNPSSFSVFLRALQQTNKARITSLPSVLALDNKPALVRSTQEQPYTSVNASNTVSTTSLGGYAEAGTTLEMTPHIAPADYLNIEYRLEVSSFTGSASSSNGAAIPPPKQSDSISSFVSVPDGSTVIVGGLVSTNVSKAVSKVPGLGDIPLLGLIGRSENSGTTNATFYVFVRPTILRAERFEDLKFISGQPRAAVQVEDDYPKTKSSFIR